MRILVFGANRSGTTLLWKSISSLLPTSRISINSLFSSVKLTTTEENSDIYYSLPSFSSSAISFHSQSGRDTTFSSRFNFPLDLDQVPQDCILRINQLTPSCLPLLGIFDHVFVAKRSEESLLISNLLDLPPAVEALSLPSVSRFELSKICAVDDYWLECLYHYIRSQESIIKLLKYHTKKLSIVDFSNLVCNHKETLRFLSEKLRVTFSPSTLSEISSSLLYRSQSRWSSHYSGSLNNAVQTKPSISDILEGSCEKRDTSTYLSLLADYKKFIFCGEFGYPFQSPISDSHRITYSSILKLKCDVDTLSIPIYSSLTLSHD